jgi:hypothetical protein
MSNNPIPGRESLCPTTRRGSTSNATATIAGESVVLPAIAQSTVPHSASRLDGGGSRPDDDHDDYVFDDPICGVHCGDYDGKCFGGRCRRPPGHSGKHCHSYHKLGVGYKEHWWGVPEDPWLL